MSRPEAAASQIKFLKDYSPGLYQMEKNHSAALTNSENHGQEQISVNLLGGRLTNVWTNTGWKVTEQPIENVSGLAGGRN